MSRRTRNVWRAVFVPVAIGCIGLFSLIERPRFAAFHTVDVLQLLASGACFGVALAALLLIFKPFRAE